MKLKKLGVACVLLSGALVLTACGSTDKAKEKNTAGVLVKDNNGYKGTFQNLSKAYDENAAQDYILYLYATSCPHCTNNKKMINEYAVKSDALPIYGYDLDNPANQAIVQGFIDKYGFKFEGTPTTIHIKNGNIENLMIGTQEITAMPVKSKEEGVDNADKTVSEMEESNDAKDTENAKEQTDTPK